MKRPLFNVVLAAVLALSALLGVFSPASAADVQPVAEISGYSASIPDVEQNQDDGATSFDTAAAAASDERWIEVNLAQRRLIAHQGNGIFLTTIVSIGKPSTPTVKGTFRIYAKLRSTRMRGPGYNLPNVPHTLYFRGGYAIHGAYWIKGFGGMVSHGCVNVNLADAGRLFNWASVGTRVWIH